MFTAITNLIKEPSSIVTFLGKHRLLSWLPDKSYIQLAYLNEMGVKLNLESPTLYSEKIQWVKLYDRKAIYSLFVDKYAVRAHIARTIGEEYLVPLYAVYKSPDEIDVAVLPDQFILKCNHSSGMNIICRDKARFNIIKVRQVFNKWLRINWFYYGREWAYKNVTPMITCEKYLSTTGVPPKDYKVACFNGIAKLVEVHDDRFNSHIIDTYTRDWNLANDLINNHPKATVPNPKPKFLEEMLRLSEVLSKNTYQTRIDWFYFEDQLYFGEITLYDSSGFLKKNNPSANRLLGDWIELPNKKQTN